MVSVELKKTIFGKYVFVSDEWVSNASFAVRKEFVSNRDEFSDERIFNMTGNFKGLLSDFSKEDSDFNKFTEGTFNVKFQKTNVCIKEDKNTFYIFTDGNETILIDSLYVDSFDIKELYGSGDIENVVYVNDPDKIDFFVADVDAEFDKVIVKKFIDFGKSDSKSEKKMNKFFK